MRYGEEREQKLLYAAQMATTLGYSIIRQSDKVSLATFDDRLRPLENVRKAGVTVCSGGIIGMGESAEDRCEMLRTLADDIEPRTDWTLIHGELAPDHVLRTAAREPVVIDIEGLMYFDVEWEHVFLRLTYGKAYHWLRIDGLDEQRMRP